MKHELRSIPEKKIWHFMATPYLTGRHLVRSNDIRGLGEDELITLV
ncbi:MAG TPA: hypothetical protein VFE08_09440 [Candidatus Sulfotelmatobacter sp.]|nr:hypothetical protein [Candidatus Sulfotelmatobacter sp.]